MGNRVYVGNLSFGTTTQELKDAFARCGSVTDAKVMSDRDTGQSRGFGFVTFASDAEAAEAINQWNGADLGGRRLVVNEARERTAPAQPGGFHSGGGYSSDAGGRGRGDAKGGAARRGRGDRSDRY